VAFSPQFARWQTWKMVSTRLHDAATLRMGCRYLNTVLELMQPVTQGSLSDAAQEKYHGKRLP
jgi:hypothetical protein